MPKEKRIVNAEAIARKLKNAYCAECNVVRQVQCSACWVNDVLELLDGDSVDAVEVVRCKDCKHWAQLESGGFCDNPEGLLCFDKPNDFCCYGERKDNG